MAREKLEFALARLREVAHEVAKMTAAFSIDFEFQWENRRDGVVHVPCEILMQTDAPLTISTSIVDDYPIRATATIGGVKVEALFTPKDLKKFWGQLLQRTKMMPIEAVLVKERAS